MSKYKTKNLKHNIYKEKYKIGNYPQYYQQKQYIYMTLYEFDRATRKSKENYKREVS